MFKFFRISFVYEKIEQGLALGHMDKVCDHEHYGIWGSSFVNGILFFKSGILEKISSTNILLPHHMVKNGCKNE